MYECVTHHKGSNQAMTDRVGNEEHHQLADASCISRLRGDC